MAINWDAHVLAPLQGVFGEGVIYRPRVGDALAISGVFDQDHVLVVMGQDGVPVSTVQPVIGVRAADFPSAARPLASDLVDVLSVGLRFRVADCQPDGHGDIMLILQGGGRLSPSDVAALQAWSAKPIGPAPVVTAV